MTPNIGLSLVRSRVLAQTDNISVRILYGCDPPATADVFDFLDDLRARIDERLQTRFDVIDCIVRRHALLMTIRIQTDVLVAHLKPDIVRLVCVRRDAQKLAEHRSGFADILDRVNDGLDSFVHRTLLELDFLTPLVV